MKGALRAPCCEWPCGRSPDFFLRLVSPRKCFCIGLVVLVSWCAACLTAQDGPRRVIVRLVVCLIMLLALPATAIPQSLPRSVLILDQSDTHSAWYASFSAAFRSTLHAGSADHTSVYAEHLDFSRFGGNPVRRSVAQLSSGKISLKADRLVGRPGGVIVGIFAALTGGALAWNTHRICRN